MRRGLGWRVVRCGLTVRSDPHLLEQVVRNFVANAIHYTEKGKVLLGCRRRGDRLRIEVWDTGIGIPGDEISKIFEEYHRAPGQAGQPGLGLGLGIAQSLGQLMGHPIDVRSEVGKGSVFAIEVPISRARGRRGRTGPRRAVADPVKGRVVLIVEDDPTSRELLAAALTRQGCRTASAATGDAALALVADDGFRPDVIVSNYLLPGEMNGGEAARALRAALGREIPIVFLTGDITAASRPELDLANTLRLAKPVKPATLTRTIRRVLGGTAERGGGRRAGAKSPRRGGAGDGRRRR